MANAAPRPAQVSAGITEKPGLLAFEEAGLERSTAILADFQPANSDVRGPSRMPVTGFGLS